MTDRVNCHPESSGGNGTHPRGESRSPSEAPLPDEALLLAYVEDELSDADAEVIERELVQRPWLRTVLSSLRRDRGLLVEIGAGEEPAPPHLVERAMARVERSMLLDDDVPLAPAIQLPSRTPSFTRRLAAAAGLTILVTVAGALTYKALFSADNFDEEIIDRFLAQRESATTDEAGSVISDGSDAAETAADDAMASAATGGSAVPSEAPTSLSADGPGAGPESVPADTRLAVLSPRDVIVADDDNLLFSEESGDRPGRSFPITRSSSLDVGLALNMSWGDLAEGLDFLASKLSDSPCGTLIQNVSLEYSTNPLPVGGNGAQPNVSTSGDPESQGRSQADDRAPGRDSVLPSSSQHDGRIMQGTNPTAKQMVTVDEQLAYEERGYQFVLVGTPSELNTILRLAAANAGCRVEWASESVARGRVLETMSSPAAPKGEQWIDAILWWDHQDIPKALRLARRTTAAAQPEPLLRIPIRIVEEPRLKVRK